MALLLILLFLLPMIAMAEEPFQTNWLTMWIRSRGTGERPTVAVRLATEPIRYRQRYEWSSDDFAYTWRPEPRHSTFISVFAWSEPCTYRHCGPAAEIIFERTIR